jgi:hypothetical protein
MNYRQVWNAYQKALNRIEILEKRIKFLEAPKKIITRKKIYKKKKKEN